VSRDHYPATPQLVRVGSGRAATIAQGSAPHLENAFIASTAGRPPYATSAVSEWLTDELLVSSQSEDVDAPLTQQRIPGRFAVAGWSRIIGEPAEDLGTRPDEQAVTRPGAGDFLPP